MAARIDVDLVLYCTRIIRNLYDASSDWTTPSVSRQMRIQVNFLIFFFSERPVYLPKVLTVSNAFTLTIILIHDLQTVLTIATLKRAKARVLRGERSTVP